MFGSKNTPVFLKGLLSLDHKEAKSAVISAWSNPGPNPMWHSICKREVSNVMPVLARALDRLVEEESNHTQEETNEI